MTFLIDDYQRMAQEHRELSGRIKRMADTVDMRSILCRYCEQVKNWGNGELLAMPYQPYNHRRSGIIRIYGKRLDLQNRISRIPGEKLIRVCRKIKNSDSGLSAMTCDESM